VRDHLERGVRYTVITPTILRPTLALTCESIGRQTNGDWQHVVVVDLPASEYCHRLHELTSLDDPRRVFAFCGERHNDFGNTCRRSAWELAQGEYVLYLDDDDHLADDGVFRELERVTYPWAVFPALRHGERFFNLPPGLNRTGTAMFIAKREICQFIKGKNEYAADGLLVERLAANFPYQALEQSRPLCVIPESHYGA
jgi:glycosyltransferase involved in cell wall biosynthesis